jgi:acetyltransferase-like isoleucine patch superfamily enzyme
MAAKLTLLMSRIAAVTGRYGWRTPFVILGVIISNLWGLRNSLRVLKLLLLTKGAKGRGLHMGRDISYSKGAFIEIGMNSRIEDRSILEISINPPARLQIGNDTWVSHDCHICAARSISIGNDVLVGEFASIRDSSHSHTDISMPIKSQPDRPGTIQIEDGVWIGRGSIIIGKPEGVIIGMGAIVGANSVVLKSIPAMEIWGGVPARFIKIRTTSEMPKSV